MEKGFLKHLTKFFHPKTTSPAVVEKALEQVTFDLEKFENIKEDGSHLEALMLDTSQYIGTILDYELKKLKDGTNKDKGLPLKTKELLLAIEETRCKSCERCPLSKDRKNIVFGRGFPGAKVMFIAEAPGEKEDELGLPFMGPAGELFEKILSAMNLKREEIYISNTCKCHPANNRPPAEEEAKACAESLRRQIEIVNPKIIVTLGAIATKYLLDKPEPIGKLRGQFFEYNGFKVLPTFHPAFLLRNPTQKRHAWADVQKVMSELGEG